MSLAMGAYVVTGAGSGIGRAIAAKITQEGYTVFGLGRSLRKLQETAQQLGSQKFQFSAVDLARADDSSRATQEIRRWLGQSQLKLLGLVNNAGVFDRLSFVQSSDVIWEKHFQINLLSAVRLTRDLFVDLKSTGEGSVLNISSTLGLRPISETIAYSAIKGAMINWTQGLALEWAKEKIRVNCICPGLVDTPIHGFFGQDESLDSRRQAHAAQPMGRMGTPEDIAEAAWFLLSEKSKWTTGSVLSVDGGIHL